MAKINFGAFEDTAEQLAAVAAANGPKDVVRAGWVPPEDRDAAQAAADKLIRETIPDFGAFPRAKSAADDATSAKLWDCWAAAYPKGWPGVRQITGSCVGAGGGNALFSLACADVVKRRDPERAVVPLWLLPYGISRMLGGLGGRGEGSFGSAFARAVREYGHIPADGEGLPRFEDSDGYTWGRDAELEWSNGKQIAGKWLDAARPHLVKTTALCRSPDDVREALRSYYAVTCASNWGGQMRPPVTDGVLLNRRATTWMHQMSVQGWTDHPRLGELFYILNQWGKETHGWCPTGAPAGGFWVSRKDMADIVSQGETFAFSQFDGFPAPVAPIDFSAF